MEFLTRLCNELLERQRLDEEWKSALQRNKVHEPYNEVMGQSGGSQTMQHSVDGEKAHDWATREELYEEVWSGRKVS